MANPKSNEARQAFLDQEPFQGFQIKNNSILDGLDGRHPCPKCGKSRKFFCYTCYVPIAQLEGILPTVKLPIKIDIIKHKHEIDGKSTAAHAAVLAPEDVNIYTYPDIPDYKGDDVVLIFPSRTAISISQLVHRERIDSEEGLHPDLRQATLMNSIKRLDSLRVGNAEVPITKAVFIDSTWNQSRGIYKDERIKRIQCVVIQNRISQFWRHQKGSPRWYLATIEAIHQFLLELHLYSWGLDPNYQGISNCFTESALKTFHNLHRNGPDSYNGQYDNLLFFFQHMYHLIHNYYDHNNLHAYKRRLT